MREDRGQRNRARELLAGRRVGRGVRSPPAIGAGLLEGRDERHAGRGHTYELALRADARRTRIAARERSVELAEVRAEPGVGRHDGSEVGRADRPLGVRACIGALAAPGAAVPPDAGGVVGRAGRDAVLRIVDDVGIAVGSGAAVGARVLFPGRA